MSTGYDGKSYTNLTYDSVANSHNFIPSRKLSAIHNKYLVQKNVTKIGWFIYNRYVSFFFVRIVLLTSLELRRKFTILSNNVSEGSKNTYAVETFLYLSLFISVSSHQFLISKAETYLIIFCKGKTLLFLHVYRDVKTTYLLIFTDAQSF